MNETRVSEQFEIEDKKYSIVGVYSVIDFLHKFIDGEFQGTAAYVILHKDKPDSPLVPEFSLKIENNMGTLLRYYNQEKIAVYERMPIIKYPERICGNCRGFVKHYSASESFLGISESSQGHCVGRHHPFNRNRDDKPKDDKCFNWNAECLSILEHLNIKESKQNG